MMIGAEPGTCRAAARWPWLALVLVALIHVVACAHGPLAGGSGRTDIITVTGLAPHVVSHGASEHAAKEAEKAEKADSCGGQHHGPQQCAGFDEPTWAQAGRGKELMPQQGPPHTEAVGGVAPGRAPPVREVEVPRPGGGQRAALQVWRN
ncbi:hypothetical protein JK364_18975 [Streptomyces sp. 110]|uniref:Uncharacterized protein n=1 Tax=Streptomyces endocoffeicus TaxID=2898945 RepID=A0ABS1PRX8_9ACTN|nr:hypothetical protein [Streptomyces endocoffeicus]MBL1114461.1 hypothetical protein [Streptomyces endocoffeicus]